MKKEKIAKIIKGSQKFPRWWQLRKGTGVWFFKNDDLDCEPLDVSAVTLVELNQLIKKKYGRGLLFINNNKISIFYNL